jgi:MerR family transcriptional regulator, light-induced transcriptional regulator
MQAEFYRDISRIIDAQSGVLAEEITRRHFQLKPELATRYGEKGREKCLEDARYHLSHLSEAIAASRPKLFADYVAWAKVLLAGYGITETDLADNLKLIRASLLNRLPVDAGVVAAEYLDEGLRIIDRTPSEPPSFITESEPHAVLAEKYLNVLLQGERHAASQLILDAVNSGVSVKDIYLYVFQRTQCEIGRLWQMNRLTVAQEHYCTAATQMIMSQLYPFIFTGEKNDRTMVATCVAGDYHEIGVRMVADFFEMDGWNTIYLGANVPTPSILKILIEKAADLIVISATMTFHVRAVSDLAAAIRESEATKNVKVMVGGYPFNVEPELWKEIGADGYSSNADEAVKVANALLGKANQ